MKKILLMIALMAVSTPALAQVVSKGSVQRNTYDFLNAGDFTASDDVTVGDDLTVTDDADITGSLTFGDVLGSTDDEIDRIADDSDRVNAISGTVAADCATHGTGQINYISSTGANATITLPAASGTGCSYYFTWTGAPVQTGSDVIQVTGDDSFNGVFWMAQDSGNTAVAFETASDTDKLSFNSSTQGVATAGAWVKFIDIATDVWLIGGSSLIGTGTEATPGATGQRS